MTLEAEFTIEPFKDGDPGPHVTAALAAAREHDVIVEVGPFGSAIRGEDAAALAAMHDMLCAAMAAGATRVSLQVSR
ncbi:MAG: hypothetical protein ACC652_00305 [Acidimicrobiales bacterium]